MWSQEELKLSPHTTQSRHNQNQFPSRITNISIHKKILSKITHIVRSRNVKVLTLNGKFFVVVVVWGIVCLFCCSFVFSFLCCFPSNWWITFPTKMKHEKLEAFSCMASIRLQSLLERGSHFYLGALVLLSTLLQNKHVWFKRKLPKEGKNHHNLSPALFAIKQLLGETESLSWAVNPLVIATNSRELLQTVVTPKVLGRHHGAYTKINKT